MTRILTFCLLCLVAAGLAAPPAAEQSSYAQTLADKGDWYRAVTETYRESFLSDRSDRNGLLDLKLGELYLRAGNYPVARNHLLLFMKRPGADDLTAARIKRLISRTYEMESDYRNAFYQIETVHFRKGSDEDYAVRLKRFEFQLKYPATDLKSLAAEWKSLTNSATTNARQLREKYSGSLRLLALKTKEAGHLKRKSGFLTGLFSVIPGLNLIYLGEYRQGLINFTAHAALIGLTWYEFDRGENVGGTVLSLTELSWYLYNFTNGFDRLRHYNQEREKEFQASFSLDFAF